MAESLVQQLVIIVATTAGIWLGSEWLEESSARLASHYDLPPVVQGGLIAAAGSSFPELASVVFAALAGSFGLGVGAVIGSAIFNILVIPALSVLMAGQQMQATRTLVHKETLFYLFSVMALFLLFALAVIYAPVDGSRSGTLSRLMVLFPIGVYSLYLFLQWQDTTDYDGRESTLEVDVLRQWARLLVGLLVILVTVKLLVDAVIIIGEAAGTPEELLGVVIVAAATSLPDALVSVRAAGKERSVASISNVVGSNIFDLMVVIPLGVLLTGPAVVDFSIAAPMMACLVAATVLLFVALRTNLALTKRESWVLLVAYTAFVAWVSAEAVGIVDLLPSGVSVA